METSRSGFYRNLAERFVLVASVGLVASLGFVACGKGKAKSAVGDDVTAPALGDAAPTATKGEPARPSGTSGDILLDKTQLPRGAVAIIGVPSLVNPGYVKDVALSGALLLACGGEYVRLWDTSTGALLWGHRVVDAAARCALSPAGDRVAVISDAIEKGTRIDVYDWKARTSVGDRTTANTVRFSSDGKQLLGARGGVEIRDASTGKLASKPVAAVAAGLSADGTLIAVDRKKVLRIKAGSKTPEDVTALPASITDAVVSQNASTVAWTSGTQTGTVDLATGATKPLTGDLGGKVETLALSATGDLLAVGVAGGLSVWDVKAGSQLWALPKGRGLPPALAFSADGSSLVYSDSRGRLIVAESRTGTAPQPTPRHAFVAFALDGAAIVKKGDKRTAINLDTGAASDAFEEEKDPPGRPEWADVVVAGTTGAALAYSSEQASACGPLKIWVPGSGERTLPKPTKCNVDDASQTWQVGPGIAVATNTPMPEVWDAIGKKKLFAFDRGIRPLNATAISPDGKVLLVVLDPGPLSEDEAEMYSDKEPRNGTRFEVWSVSSGKRTGELRIDHEGVTAVALGRDGSKAFLGWKDGTVSVLDAKAMSEPQKLGAADARIKDITVSPDGRRIAVTDDVNTTTIWMP